MTTIIIVKVMEILYGRYNSTEKYSRLLDSGKFNPVFQTFLCGFTDYHQSSKLY